MGKKQKGAAPEFMVRMNYLHQSAHLLSKASSSAHLTKSKVDTLRRLSTNFSHLMVGVGLKSVTRSHPNVKRTICKGCHGVLTPGVSASININKKTITITCSFCETIKSYPLSRKKRKARHESDS